LIRYKVIKHRRSSGCDYLPTKYVLEYSYGTTVMGLEGTLGVFCFKTKKDAKRFCDLNDQIIKVRPIGRGKVPNYISSSCFNVEHFYEKSNHYHQKHPPQGTICYPAVEVLE